MFEKPAFAKINLGLHVLRRRPDGFHDIETVMVRIGWADLVRVAAAPAGPIIFGCSDDALPTDNRNTCVRAARLLSDAFSVAEGAEIYLDKRVPYGAGLGSGSSDAAAVLVMLRDLWQLDCSDEQLRVLAAEVGSDVPFFIDGAPALATGRGTRLRRLDCVSGTPYVFPFWIVVAVPPLPVSTREAYEALQPSVFFHTLSEPPAGRSDTGRPDLYALVCSNDLRRWREELSNDFELPLSDRHGPLQIVFDHFRRSGADYVSLSGTGSAVYALFETEARAHDAVAGEGLAHCRTWCGRSP